MSQHGKCSFAVLLLILFCSVPVQPEARADAGPTTVLARRHRTIAAMFHDAAAPMDSLQKPAPVPAQTATPLPEGKGKDLAQKLCGSCHSTNVWTSQRHDNEKWNSIIDNMVSKGMQASDDDLATIGDYLTLHFGSDQPVTPPPANPQ